MFQTSEASDHRPGVITPQPSRGPTSAGNQPWHKQLGRLPPPDASPAAPSLSFPSAPARVLVGVHGKGSTLGVWGEDRMGSQSLGDQQRARKEDQPDARVTPLPPFLALIRLSLGSSLATSRSCPVAREVT